MLINWEETAGFSLISLDQNGTRKPRKFYFYIFQPNLVVIKDMGENIKKVVRDCCFFPSLNHTVIPCRETYNYCFKN